MHRVPVILNKRAGGRRRSAENEIRDAFAAHALAADVSIPRDHAELIALASAAAKREEPLLVVAGGDGSLHGAAGALAGTKTALGILPLGTFNHFARDLDLPLALDDAVRVVAGGRKRRVDVGEANGRVFLNNASVGVYASVVRLREGMQQRLGRGKWPAFFLAVWRTLSRYEPLHVRIRMKKPDEGDGANGHDTHDRRTPFVFIGNNAYAMEALSLGRRASLEEGVLSLHVARCEGPFALVRLALRAIAGRLRQTEDFEWFRAEEVEITTPHHREFVGLDGEVVKTGMPLRCRTRPRDLEVVVPEPGAA